jgi:hypothetical protein|tara:strand:+ start:536 stop:1249 length:714 start_codon:yes stop_codon:yes gene_type:complete
MALPKINTPTYELVIPSTDEKIEYRPFLVKEEKILLIAMESGQQKDIITAIKQIVTACTFGKLKIGRMPMFDVEYLFLNIRAKSVGEVSTLNLIAPDDKETQVEVEVDLNEIQIQEEEGHTNKIELTDEMGIYMQYPTVDTFGDSGITDINASNMLDVITACIAQIYDKKGEEVFEAKDQTKKEMLDFVEQLNSKQFQDVQSFFDTAPKLKHEITIKNPKTKVESKVVLSGLSDFFA